MYPSQKLAVPASCAHLDLAVIKAELVRTEGNITAAATALSVPSVDLRKLVWSTTSLADAVFEQIEQMTTRPCRSCVTASRIRMRGGGFRLR
jgi:hypothetical protein